MHVGASSCTIKQYFNTEVIGKEVIDSVHTLELVRVFLAVDKKAEEWLCVEQSQSSR